MSTSTSQGRFVWFEHVSPDQDRAQGFYGEVFGWKHVPFTIPGEPPYTMIQSGDAPVGGYASLPGSARWMTYVAVDDVDASVTAIVAAGGRTLDAPLDVPTIGRMARVADPQGAELWVMRGEGDPMPEAPATSGMFTWSELWTPDPAAAVTFYERALGYTHEDMDMGPAGLYRVLSAGGQRRAGILAGDPVGWLPYVQVDDCDGTAARVRRAGGTVETPPEDIPGIGRFAIFRDPFGARIAALQPSPK